MRIVCLGDSLTWGKYGGSYVNALASLKPEHTFINAGVGGDTVVNLARRLESDVIAQTPDAVFVMVGCNDAISWLYPATRPYYQHSKKVPGGYITVDAFAHHYRDILEQLQLAHILTWVGLEPAEYSALLDAELRLYNAQAREAATMLNLPVLDLYAELHSSISTERPMLGLDTIQLIGRRSQQGWQDYEAERLRGGFRFTFDGLHPTPHGAQQIARHIAAFIDRHFQV
jgi:lysophospholipase L1-like esterase